MTRKNATMTTEPVAPASTTLQQVPLEEIDTHPGNPRVDVGDVTELAASIEQQGILEPLLVAPNVLPGAVDDPPAFVLLAGHRRLAAAQVAGLQEVPCIVRHDLTDPARQLETMLVENLQRTDLTPVEEAAAYQALLEFPGYDVKRISNATGRSAATVRGRLQLGKLPEETRSRIQSRQITLAEAQALAEFFGEPEYGPLERSIGSPNWSWALERARSDRRDRLTLAKRAKAIAKEHGCRVITADELYALEEAEEQRAQETDTEIDEVYVLLAYRPQIDPAAHVSCPGHALLIEGAEDEPEAICLQPALHPAVPRPRDAQPGPEDGDEQDERAARAAEQQQRLDRIDIDLRTAQTVRRRYLGDLLRNPADKASLALALARAHMQDRLRSTFEAEFLGDLLFPERTNDAAIRERCADRVAKFDLVQLAILDGLLRVSRADVYLQTHHGWPANGDGRAGQTEPWRRHLVDLFGYEWSDIEAQQNIDPDDDDVEADADDVDEDVEEDELEAVAP